MTKSKRVTINKSAKSAYAAYLLGEQMKDKLDEISRWLRSSRYHEDAGLDGAFQVLRGACYGRQADAAKNFFMWASISEDAEIKALVAQQVKHLYNDKGYGLAMYNSYGTSEDRPEPSDEANLRKELNGFLEEYRRQLETESVEG